MNGVSISILGCGWLGLALGRHLAKLDYKVSGSTTSREKLPLLRLAGINPFEIRFDPDLVTDSLEFFRCDVLIIAFPPKLSTSGEAFYLKQVECVKRECLKSGTKKIVFISSTSVYADAMTWVREEDADSGSPLVKAEKMFIDKGLDTTVIRFAGLVGPGRHPGRFLSGKKVAGALSPVNIIHLDDCVGIIEKVIRGNVWNVTLNASADLHPTRESYYNAASIALGIPLPEFTARSGPYKLICNDKLKAVLAYRFMHPDPMQMTY